MNKLYLLLFLIIFSSKLQAQKLEVENRLDSLTSDKLKVDFLNQWSKKNYKKLTKEAQYYTKIAKKIANSNSYISGIADTYMQEGRIFFYLTEFDSALNAYNLSIRTYSSISDSVGIYKAYLNRGLTFKNKDQYNLAINDYYKSLNYFEQNKDPHLLSLLYNNIGIIHKQLKNFNKALSYYKKSAKVCIDYNLNSSLFYSNTNIANIYSIQNNFKEALKYYKQNLDVLEKRPNKYRLAQTFHNIGACFLYMKQYSMALEYQKQSLQLKEEIGNKNLIITSLNGISTSNYMLNNLKEALTYSKRAYLLGKEVGNIEYQRNSTKEIFKIYTHKNLADSAIHYFGIHEQLRDSILNTETLKQVNEIQAKYEAEKKEAHIAILEKENKNKVMQRNGLMIILVLIAAYAAFIVRSYYRNKKTTRLLSLQKTRIEWSKEILDQKNKDLLVSNQTKNKLFQIISHDLRSPLASVSGIAKLIQIFIQQGRYGELNDSSKDLGESVTRVLNLTDNLLSWSLNQSGRLPYTPVVLSVNKLLSGIFETYQSVAQEKSIHMELTSCDSLFIYGDRSMLETVVRNLINNAIKFTPDGGIIMAGAKLKDGITEIWIKDSGKGIPEEHLSDLFKLDDGKSNLGTRGEQGNGLGLILCKDFIAQNDGEIWVESKENIGSTFRFTVPNAEKVYQEDLISKQ